MADHARRRLVGLTWQEALAGYLFAAPTLLLLAVFTGFPVLHSLWISFHRWNLAEEPHWIGLQNYVDVLQDPYFWKALGNTLYFTAASVPLQMLLGLGAALLLNRRIRGIGLFRTGFYLPVITSVVAASAIWMWIYRPSGGLLNALLEWLGLPPQKWLLDPRLAMPSVVLMSVWKGFGSPMLLYLAGLQGVDRALLEAAQIDGANRWQVFRHVTWPLLAPTTLFTSVMSVISALKSFEQIYVMTGGGPVGKTTTVVYLIYTTAFERFRMGYASAIAFVFFIVIFGCTLLQWKLSRGRQSVY